MYQTISRTLGHSLVAGTFALCAVGAAVPPAFAKPAAAHRMQAKWLADTAASHHAHHWHHHLLKPHCSAAYPMHHGNRCGSATGGPSGGLY